MKNFTKAPKYVEEKKMNMDKKKARAQQRDKKNVAWDEAIVVEQEPQMETPKEFEESFKHWKRCFDTKDPLYQRDPKDPLYPKESPVVVARELADLTLEDIETPHQESEEGWESDGDDWFE